MNPYERLLASVLGYLLLMMVTGCASTAAGVTMGVLDKVFEDKPPKLEATIEAVADLNPDYAGEPSPLVVRVYELTTLNEFNAAQFYSLYENDAELLGADLKAREEMLILPSETKELKRTLNMETRYIGIIGAYRDLEQAVWRISLETPIDKTTRATIEIGSNQISIGEVDR